jgi:hypothetical protein
MARSNNFAAWRAVCMAVVRHGAIPKDLAGETELDLAPHGPQTEQRECKWGIQVVPEAVAATTAVAASGRMEVMSANGRRVVVGPDVDTAALLRVLEALER